MDTTIGRTRFSKLWGQNASPNAKQKGRSLDDADDHNGKPPPALPPKDGVYAHSFYAKSASSLLPSSTPRSNGATSKFLGLYSPAGSQTNLTIPNHSSSPLQNMYSSTSSAPANALSFKSKFKLPKLTRRPSTSPSVASSNSVHSTLPEGGDSDITSPYNFHHDIHVDEDYAGLPVQWSNALSAAGYSHAEIQAFYARKIKPTLPTSAYASTSQLTLNTSRERADSSATVNPPPLSVLPPIPAFGTLHHPYGEPETSGPHAPTPSNPTKPSLETRRVAPPPVPPAKDKTPPTSQPKPLPKPNPIPNSPPPQYTLSTPSGSQQQRGGTHYTYSDASALSNTSTAIPLTPTRNSKDTQSSGSSSPQSRKDKRQSGFNIANLSIRKDLRKEKSGGDLHAGATLSPVETNGTTAALRPYRSAVDLKGGSLASPTSTNIRRPSRSGGPEDDSEEEDDQLMPLPKSRAAELPPRLSFNLTLDEPGASLADELTVNFGALGSGSLGFELDDWGADLMKALPAGSAPAASDSAVTKAPAATTSAPAPSPAPTSKPASDKPITTLAPPPAGKAGRKSVEEERPVSSAYPYLFSYYAQDSDPENESEDDDNVPLGQRVVTPKTGAPQNASTTHKPTAVSGAKPPLLLPSLQARLGTGSSPVPSPSSERSAAFTINSGSILTPTSGISSLSASPPASPSLSPNPASLSFDGLVAGGSAADKSSISLNTSLNTGARPNTLNSIMSPTSPIDPSNPATVRQNALGSFGTTSTPPSVLTNLPPTVLKPTAPLVISPKKKNPALLKDHAPVVVGKASIVRSASRAKRTSAAFAVVLAQASEGGKSTPSPKNKSPVGDGKSPTTPKATPPLPPPVPVANVNGRDDRLSPATTPTAFKKSSPASKISDISDSDDDGKGLLPYLRSPAVVEYASFAEQQRVGQSSTAPSGNTTPQARSPGTTPRYAPRPISTFTPTLVSDDEEDESVRDAGEGEEDGEGEGMDVGDVLEWYDDGAEDGEEDGVNGRRPLSRMLLGGSGKPPSVRTPTAQAPDFPTPPKVVPAAAPPRISKESRRSMTTDSDSDYGSDRMSSAGKTNGVVVPQKRPLPGPLLPLSAHMEIKSDYHNRMKKFANFTLIAEGQSGSCVYSAVVGSPLCNDTGNLVAIKVVDVPPEDERERVEERDSRTLAKLASLTEEMEILRGVSHPNVLTLSGAYLVDAEESPTNGEGEGGEGDDDDEGPELVLWLEMELMERSVADVLAFVAEGLVIGEQQIARFAKDILQGLGYLQSVGVAHRDVRSDNILVSRTGLLKLSDFSSSTLTTPSKPKRTSVANQPPYWMAPEMRRGLNYNPYEADIWSVGATIWEVVEGDPPFIDIEDPQEFGDRLPPLTSPTKYSRHLHDFLRRCSESAAQRPRASDLSQTLFVRSACPPYDIVRLMTQVRAMEGQVKGRKSASSDRTA